MVDAYDMYLHKSVFPPSNPATVRCFSLDGHCKVAQKLCAQDTVPARSGRPREDGKGKGMQGEDELSMHMIHGFPNWQTRMPGCLKLWGFILVLVRTLSTSLKLECSYC